MAFNQTFRLCPVVSPMFRNHTETTTLHGRIGEMFYIVSIDAVATQVGLGYLVPSGKMTVQGLL